MPATPQLSILHISTHWVLLFTHIAVPPFNVDRPFVQLVCVCVCERVRDRETDWEREKIRKTKAIIHGIFWSANLQRICKLSKTQQYVHISIKAYFPTEAGHLMFLYLHVAYRDKWLFQCNNVWIQTNRIFFSFIILTICRCKGFIKSNVFSSISIKSFRRISDALKQTVCTGAAATAVHKNFTTSSSNKSCLVRSSSDNGLMAPVK